MLAFTNVILVCISARKFYVVMLELVFTLKWSYRSQYT